MVIKEINLHTFILSSLFQCLLLLKFLQKTSNISYTYANRHYAVVLVIGGGSRASSNITVDFGPYNEDEADRANSNGQPYTYIAGIVETSDISDYPYPYTVGDESRSSIGGIDYENVPLQSNTMYAVIVRAYTADDLVS